MYSITVQVAADGIEAMGEEIDSISGTKSRLRKDKDPNADKRKNSHVKVDADVGKIENSDAFLPGALFVPLGNLIKGATRLADIGRRK